MGRLSSAEAEQSRGRYKQLLTQVRDWGVLQQLRLALCSRGFGGRTLRNIIIVLH